MSKPLHGTRRSRRLSKQPPRDPEFETLDLDEVQHHSDGGAVDHSSPESSSSPRGPPQPPTTPSRGSQRSSHSRKKADGHIPRPPNCFLLFRSDHWQAIKEDPATPRTHTAISQIAAARWSTLPEEERRYYKDLAKLESEAHRQKYPGYKYQPGSRKDKRVERNASRKTNANKTLRAKKLASHPSQGVGKIQKVLRRDDIDSDPEYAPSPRCAPRPLRGSVERKEVQSSRVSLGVSREMSEPFSSAPSTPETEDIGLPSTPDSGDVGLPSSTDSNDEWDLWGPDSGDVQFPSTPDWHEPELPLYNRWDPTRFLLPSPRLILGKLSLAW
ncbi:hypothetical protein BKA93DRAFT_495243 [Sparassis latifolia]